MAAKKKGPAAKGFTEALYHRMLTDLPFYSASCLQIRDKEAKVHALRFNEAQSLVHKKLTEQYRKENRVRAIILKARQTGFSTYTAARFFRRIHLLPNQQSLVIAHEKEPAQILFGIYDRFHAYLPPEVSPRTRYVSKQTQMVFDNPDDKTRAVNPGLGSSVSIETANDAAVGRGATYQMVHASEVAFWQKPEEAWISLMQAVPDNNSEVIIESTANGVGNFFHQMWLAAEEGANGYVPIFLPWWIHEEYSLPLTEPERRYVFDSLDDLEKSYVNEGIQFEGVRHKLTLEQIAWRRQTIRDKLAGDERVFRQEYPATAEEAFLVSGNCFFDEDQLKKYQEICEPPKARMNIVRVGSAVVAKRATFGYLRVWEMPDPKGLYVIAADTASGRQVSAKSASIGDPDQERGGRDFSSADVYRVDTKKFVAQLHGRMAPEIFADQLFNLGLFYASGSNEGMKRTPTKLAVENNHESGSTVLRILKEDLKYPNLYYGRQINRRTNRTEQVLGWRTTGETRMPMLDELAAMVRNDAVTILNKDTIKEMFTFVRGQDGKPQAQEGAHDDRVISAAIALQIARAARIPLPRHYNEVDLVPTGTDSPTGWF